MPPDPDQLYALPLERFTEARRDLARKAREAGDADLAETIARLPKPTKAAHLLNTLVRDDPTPIEALTALGDALRTAHTTGDGPALRDLTARRTELINDTLATIGRQSDTITRDLTDMLTAAVADPDAAKTLLSGRAISPRELSAPAWPGLPIATPTRKPTPRKPRPNVAEAKAAVKAAEADRAAADRAVTKAETAVEKAEHRVRDANDALDAAEAAETEARKDLHTARKQAKDAERAASQAWRRLQQIEAD